MSDSPKKEILEQAESTIFSAPAEHNDKQPKSGKMIPKILAAFLSLCIVAGGLVGVVKLIPEKTEGEAYNTISVLNLAAANIAKLEAVSENSSITILSETVEGEDSSSVDWYIENINKSYTDSAAIESAVESVSQLEAIKELSGTDSDFGFDKPALTANITAKNGAFSDVTVTIGNFSAAGGRYCKVSGSDKVYLLAQDVEELIGAVPTDFATTSGVSAANPTSENEDCFNSEGIISFDYIELSGKNYDRVLKIEPQNDDSINSYFPFKITSPTLRMGSDTEVENLLALFDSGIGSAGAYCFDPTAEDLANRRLDNPDIVLQISIKGQKYSIKASKADDDFYAVIDDSCNMIHKISASSLEFANKKIEDFYSSFIVLENLSGLSYFNADFADGRSFSFKTEYNKEDESYKAFVGDTELDIDNFKAMYQQFIGLSPVEYSEKDIAESDLKITLKHSAGTRDTVLEFKRYSAGRYQVEMDGIPMGLITASSYEKFAQNIENAATGVAVVK